MESYVLNRWRLGEIESPRSPEFQCDVDTDKLVVETPYGFGVVEKSENQFQLVRVNFLPPSSGSVSLPWDRIRVLPEKPPQEPSSDVTRTGKRNSTDDDDRTVSRLRYISN